MLCIYLTALATGSRVSELAALLRSDDAVCFSGDGVTFFPNLNFLAKNKNPLFRRNPLFISRLFRRDGSPHPLCPIWNLGQYLEVSSASRSLNLFFDSVSFHSLSLAKIRLLLCKFIRLTDPESFPKSHDLRKVASSFAFLRTMSLADIYEVVG